MMRRTNQPIVINIDDSTDEDTSILLPTTPIQPQQNQLPIVTLSDEEEETQSFQHFWSGSESDTSEALTPSDSSDDEAAPSPHNIDNILDRLSREEETEHTSPTIVHQHPTAAASTRHTNTNYNNSSNSFAYYQHRDNNTFNTHNHHHNRMHQHHHPHHQPNNTNNRPPIQAAQNRNRFTDLLNRLPSRNQPTNNLPFMYRNNNSSHTNNSSSNNNSTNNNGNRSTNLPNFHIAHHGPIVFNTGNNAHQSSPLEQMIEQQFLAQVIARSQRQQVGGGAVHPLMFVNRDFDDRDYEMLLALDDNVEKPKKTAASVVGKLPIVHIEEKECTCSICLDDLEVGSFASEIPFCNHKFHTDCIEKWLKDYGHTCPVCKQEVTEIDFNHAKIIKDETTSNKRKGFDDDQISESRFKKKKVE